MTVNNPSQSRTALTWTAWSLVTVVSILALYAWADSMGGQFDSLSSYTIFPVLGLLAFSIMWSHYMVAEIKRIVKSDAPLKEYFNWTGYAVLVLILLHPGILIYQRFRDGYGLPPGSYKSYVAPGMGWITLLGSVSLLVFLSYELKRFFDKKKWWPYFLIVNDAAMLAILYHGLKLGTQLQLPWFKYVWYFYGVTLISALIHKYVLRAQPRPVTQ
ncbi:hypothetical protein H7097_03110 [Aeromicrobium sp.]|nr:hypothetical protein [Candidatus Saccharibacteria bacterium]